MSVTDEVRENLVASRDRLVSERKRIEGAIAGIELALLTLGGGQQPAEERPAQKPPGGGATDDKAQVRQRIADLLNAAHPEGLTNFQLTERLKPTWPEITQIRVAANAKQMYQAGEIMGNGARWYWVPTDCESGRPEEGGGV